MLGSDAEDSVAPAGGVQAQALPTQVCEVLAASEPAPARRNSSPSVSSSSDYDPLADSFEERETIQLLPSVPAGKPPPLSHSLTLSL